MRTRLLLVLLALSVAPTTAQDGALFRMDLPANLLNMPTASEQVVPISASSSGPAPFAMVGETISLNVVHSGGKGARSIAPTGTMPGSTVVDDAVVASPSNAITYTMGATVSDAGGSAPVVLGPWTVVVDPALSIGNAPNLVSPVGAAQDFLLPAATGGFGTKTAVPVVVSGSTTAVTVVGPAIRVNASASGMVGTYRIDFTDGRGRKRSSNDFTVQGAAAAMTCTTQAVGTVCSDGSLFAGTHGGKKLFMPIMTIRNNLAYGSSGILRGTTSADGAVNTTILAAFGSTAHPAAHLCENYEQHGRTDWFLPAAGQLQAVLSKSVALGFSSSGVYLSSEETGAGTYKSVEAGNILTFEGKSSSNTSYKTLCIRQE